MNLLEKKLNQILFWALTSVTIVITPWSSYDPVNVSKMLLLVIFGSMALILIMSQKLFSFKSEYKIIWIIVSIFLLQMVLIIFFAPSNRLQQFYGVSGRQTGLLTYLSLVFLFITSCVSATRELSKKIIQALAISGTLSIIYGIAQGLNLDPLNWTNPYSPVMGFFGNPNFQAAFMGMTASVMFVLLLSQEIKVNLRILSFVYIASSLYVIFKSKSQQGFLVFGIGASIAFLVYVYKSSKLRKYLGLTVVLWILGFIGVLADILQKSPWNSVLYKPSVSFRGDYWRAGWEITQSNPILGTGFDSYRDWYFQNRDLTTVLRRESSNYVDSAHNILLDISSSGGIGFLITYLIILIITLISIIRVILKMKKYDPYILSIAIIWVGYTAQSVISINQIGLAIWGWVSAGFMVGFQIKSQPSMDNMNARSRNSKNEKHPAQISAALAIGLVLGALVSGPSFLADSNFRSSIESNKVETIKLSASKWPQDVIRMNYISRLFLQNKLNTDALNVARKAVKLFPDNFEAWELVYINPSTPPNEKKNAQQIMKRLNPLVSKYD
jgi:O-antigen ligase